ncbi:WXG100 family type VII secretion target [Nocardioides sp. CCNWLW239]|uniref:WXG100 family type VII secretion target n=1 Tax=Nocardioides sp. CCNWLW239 TaxID=3128902 RepID=UPI00301679C8
MTTTAMTLAAFNRALGDVDTAVDRIATSKTTADRQMRSLLGGGWTGVAADSVSEAWDEWVAAADEVREALAGMGHLLTATRDDFVQQDDASQQQADSISAKLIERLG